FEDVAQRRHREVFGRRDFAFSRGAGETEFCAVCDQWHGQTGRMHDVARTVVAEDRMKLVFTRWREAAVAALLIAVEFLVAEIPAARPLIDIAADGTLVADLRRPDVSSRGNDRGIKALDL